MFLFDTHWAPPWLLLGSYGAVGCVLVAVISLLPIGYVLLKRKFKDSKRKLTLGYYTAFWAGEGICFAFDEAITSRVLDGTTPQAFYTTPAFYILLLLVIPATWWATDRFEDDAERRGRPKPIRNWPSQIAHNRVCLPVVMYFTIWSIFPVADYHDPLWATLAFFGVLAFWWIGIMLWWDGKKPMPQTELEFTQFHPIVMMLMFGASALLNFA